MNDDKIRVLDAQMPKEDQKKLQPIMRSKKFQVTVELPNGKVRYMYGDDPVVLELYAKSINAKILKTQKVSEL